jgi:heme exporter protein CcmD
MIALLEMGKHGAYVWSAYGITLVVLALTAWLVRRRLRVALRQVRDSAEQELVAKRPIVRRMQ